MGQTDSKNTVSDVWLICGLPKAGKTTIQQKLAFQYFMITRRLPAPDWVPEELHPPKSIQTIYETRNDNGFMFIDLFPPKS